MLHPLTIEEIVKYKDPKIQHAFQIHLNEYEKLKFSSSLSKPIQEMCDPIKINDKTDLHLLNEVLLDKVDLLITQDKEIIKKAEKLSIQNRVLSIEQFIQHEQENEPKQVEYSKLNIEKVAVGTLDLNDSFFNSLRETYNFTNRNEFDEWFHRKSNEDAYVFKNTDDKIAGFLYIKPREFDDRYNNDYLDKNKCWRTKIGTFKVNATGFRLGERFLKIIFDIAISNKTDEIYVTCFQDKPTKDDPNNYGIKSLIDLLVKWGFQNKGIKKDTGEQVFVKSISFFDNKSSIIKNFPLVPKESNKFLMVIEPEWHTKLFPDSWIHKETLNNEELYSSATYALLNSYISTAKWKIIENEIKQGDILLVYRKGKTDPKHYSSCITSIVVVEQIFKDFASFDQFKLLCENRSVFTLSDLKRIYQSSKNNLCVIKFIFCKEFLKRPILRWLKENNIVPNENLQFLNIDNESYRKILKKGEISDYIQLCEK
ncbi:MAG: hypothetical protein LBF00_01785 [Mycoplasmataceae bacterium]|nr:hypothetical protein [Mycoplasmataceae bacterium]